MPYPELLRLARTDYVCTCSGAVISARDLLVRPLLDAQCGCAVDL